MPPKSPTETLRWQGVLGNDSEAAPGRLDHPRIPNGLSSFVTNLQTALDALKSAC